MKTGTRYFLSVLIFLVVGTFGMQLGFNYFFPPHPSNPVILKPELLEQNIRPPDKGTSMVQPAGMVDILEFRALDNSLESYRILKIIISSPGGWCEKCSKQEKNHRRAAASLLFEQKIAKDFNSEAQPKEKSTSFVIRKLPILAFRVDSGLFYLRNRDKDKKEKTERDNKLYESQHLLEISEIITKHETYNLYLKIIYDPEYYSTIKNQKRQPKSLLGLDDNSAPAVPN